MSPRNCAGLLPSMAALVFLVAVLGIGIPGNAGLPIALGFKAPVVPPQPLDGEESWKKARCDGKYEMLLAQIKVEDDWNDFGRFKDLGYKGRREYKGHKNLPRGHWVYVFPYWYIWRDTTDMPRPARSWGPEQAAGEPNAVMGTDSSLAWASLTEDGQEEWLLLEYAEPITPRLIEVHENYSPGALVKIIGYKLDGSEVQLWKGKDPTEPGSISGVSKIEVRADFKLTRIKLILDSKNVAGWNEIDAVGIHDDQKKVHWATAAEASSTYAHQGHAREDPRLQKLEERIESLEAEIEELQKTIKKLKEQLERKAG